MVRIYINLSLVSFGFCYFSFWLCSNNNVWNPKFLVQFVRMDLNLDMKLCKINYKNILEIVKLNIC